MPLAVLLAAHKDNQGHLLADLKGGAAVLTREPVLEEKLQKTLDQTQAPYAATVLIEVGTGRVLAVVGESTKEPQARDVAFRALAPAASVFKVVTSSALLRAGVSPDATVCVHGGHHRMSKENLKDNPRRDGTCVSLEDALAQSSNVGMAKLAQKHLTPDLLQQEAEKFGFLTNSGREVPLELPVVLADKSHARIPEDAFGFANAAAGFGDVKLSAFHGAVLASVVANDGVYVPPQLIDEGLALGLDAEKGHRVMATTQAHMLRDMMTETVAKGTARRTFADRRTGRVPTTAAGKTGSLIEDGTGLETTWFVGFAPAVDPVVIVASVVVNTGKWHLRGTTVAKDALKTYFQLHPLKAPATAAVARR
jgi:cell division protein FtsI/penicillin-binding protein 2